MVGCGERAGWELEKPTLKREIDIAIHDLSPYGGQDRSTLEIMKRLDGHFKLNIHAYSVSDKTLLARTKLVKPHIRRPVLLKAIYFYFVLLLRELLARRPLLWHTTGVSHIRSRVIHLQFLHKPWRARRKPEQESLLRKVYREFFELFNIALETLLFREGKTYIAISKSVAEDLRGFFGIQDNIHIIYHGVDPLQFFPLDEASKRQSIIRKQLNLSPTDIVAVFVGSYERKGLETLIRVLPHLTPAQRKNFKLVAVGDGNREFYHTLSRQLWVEENVRLVSKQKNIADYFQMADIFVFPTQYEPFGLVIFEALACGLPTIVSKCAGASELLSDGKNGFLIDDPTDVKEITSLIQRAIESPEKLKELAREARLLAESNSWDHVAQKYKNVLDTL